MYALTDRREEVIRRILQRKMLGASVRAKEVRREERDLFAAARYRYKNWGNALCAAGLDAHAISGKRAWSVQRLIQAIQDLHRKGVSLHHRSVLRVDQGLARAARLKFGSWDNAVRAAGYDPAAVRRARSPWTKSKIIALIQTQAAGGTLLTPYGLRPRYVGAAARRLFGSFRAALRAAGCTRQDGEYPRWSKAAVVRAIRELRESGQPINCMAIIAARPPLYDAACRYCGGWKQALCAAGLDPLQFRLKPLPLTAKDVIAELRRRAKEDNPAPSISCIQPHSIVRACNTFFGSLEAAAAAAGVDPARIAHRRGTGSHRRRHSVQSILGRDQLVWPQTASATRDSGITEVSYDVGTGAIGGLRPRPCNRHHQHGQVQRRG